MLKFFALPAEFLSDFSARTLARRVRAFLALTKPRVVSLIVFTAVIGMLLATPGMVPLRILLAAPSASRWWPAPRRRSTAWSSRRSTRACSAPAGGRCRAAS